MKVLKKIMLIIWQLPQEIIGFFVFLFCLLDGCKAEVFNEKIVIKWNLKSGLSLGSFIFVSKMATLTTRYHEYGHCLQSEMLGPAYLIVIGLPSLIWCSLFGFVYRKTINGYYKFYTEKWADKLGQITRKFY